MLALSTARDRWPLFVGAVLSTCLGSALVQSSLLLLIGAATADTGADLSAAVTLLGMTLGIGAFLTLFIVGSTFAFTVAERRTDLALLRMAGAARGQVRRLLLGEALLLGLVGSGLGVLGATVLLPADTGLLEVLGLLPPGFVAPWRDWIVAVGFGVGVGVAIAGVWASSRRGARVRPVEALREGGAAGRVMTGSRWLFGGLFFAGTVAMVLVAAGQRSPDATVPLSLCATMTGAVAMAAVAPLVVPLVGRVVGAVLRATVVGGVAEANLRAGARRSASTAAPMLALTALVAAVTTIGDIGGTGPNVPIMVALLGLSGLYTVFALVNTVVIGTAGRRREFAVLRVTGLGRGQVVAAALVEAWAATVIGLLLGVAVAGLATSGLGLAPSWPVIGALAVGGLAVVGLTATVGAVAATRRRPVALVGGRE